MAKIESHTMFMHWYTSEVKFERFGELDNITYFQFENYLFKIKKLLKKPNSPLQQVVRRLSEQSTKYVKPVAICVKLEHSDGPPLQLSVAHQYKEVNMNGLRKRLMPAGDKFLLLKDSSIVSVENIITNASGSIGLVCRKFRNLHCFFSYLLPSSDINVFQSLELGGKTCPITLCQKLFKNLLLCLTNMDISAFLSFMLKSKHDFQTTISAQKSTVPVSLVHTFSVCFYSVYFYFQISHSLANIVLIAIQY